MLDVRRHQRRRGAARRTLRLDHQPQFPRPARARRAHSLDVAGHGRRRRGDRTSYGRAAVARRPQRRELSEEKFVRLVTKACPLLLANVDTDQILPARFLKLPRSSELGRVLFDDLRRRRARQRKAGPSAEPARMARRAGPGRRAEFRRRLFARSGGLCALRSSASAAWSRRPSAISSRRTPSRMDC